jgi:ATP-dependent Lon protease
LLKRSVRGGLIVVGEINLGGSIELVHERDQSGRAWR